MNEVKVGVLLPRSSLYTLIGSDVLAGIRAGLKELGINNIRFCTENIGFGGEEKEVHAKAEKLLLEEDPLLMIAFLDHHAAAKLEPLFTGLNKMLLVLDPGGHVPESWEFSPMRFTISLQAALGSRLTARMAAEGGDMKNIFATSFYEGGYLSCYSFIRGLEKAGGSVHYHDVVPFKLETYTPVNLKNAIEHVKPDAVLAQFSAEAGEIFLRSFSQAGLDTRLYASPFMLEEEWLARVPFMVKGIRGCTAWGRSIDTESNRLFVEKIKASCGRDANVFHLLGWEAALFCGEYFSAMQASGGNVQATAAALESAELDSPRGKLVMDPSVHYFFSPMYIAEIVEDKATGNCRTEIHGEVEFTGEERKFFMTDLPSGVVSRWTNTYLCI